MISWPSVVSIISTKMKTSLASMSSIASYASKIQKLLVLYILRDFSGIRNLSTQQPLLIKKLIEFSFFINPGTKMTYPGLSMWDGSSKIHYFIDFWPSFRTEAVEDRNVDFNQIQGSMLKYMSIANEHTDAFHVVHFDFKDPVNAT